MLRHRLRLSALTLAALVAALVSAAAPATDELREKARSGDVAAQLLLAEEYLFGRNRPGNRVLAAYWYRQAAEQGSAEGEYDLGCCYEFGWGVEKCRHQALELYSRAVERGLAAAATRRAHLIYSGIPAEDLGVRHFDELPPDREAGLRELRKVCAAGFVAAKLELAMLLCDDPALRREHAEEIGRLAREAAEAPGAVIAAKLFYARCLRYGIGVIPDPARALELYRKSAELGDPSGMVFLGDRLLADGDTEGARDWYLRAAKLNYAPACAKAGDCLAFGWCAPPDPEGAVKFYEQGAKLGDANSQYRFGKALAEGKGIAADPAAAVFWYKCAGGGGCRDAVRELGAALLFGRGVPADPAEGRRLLEAAAKAGDTEAAAILNGKTR